MLIHFLTKLTQIQNILDRSKYQDRKTREIYKEIEKEVDIKIEKEDYSEVIILLEHTPKPRIPYYKSFKERDTFMMDQYFKVWSAIKQKMKRKDSSLNGLENIPYQ